MKLVATERGYASILTASDEVKPLAGLYLPDLFGAIKERYSFVKAPTTEDAKTTGARFEAGRFLLGDRTVNIDELAVFRDGFGVTTTNTDDSVPIIDDLFSWLKSHFGFRDPSSPIVHRFQSEVIVDFDRDPECLFKPLAPLFAYLGEQAGTRPFAFNGMRLTPPPFTAGEPPHLVIERRHNSPVISRYYARANVSTPSLVKALTMLDELLASPSST